MAVVDARDGHAAEEVAFWLRAPVRVVRTSLASMDAALRRLEARPAPLGMEALAPPMGAPEREEPPAAGDPGPGPNIPIPLTRRNQAALDAAPMVAPAEERDAGAHARDPVLDLSRRKAPPSAPAEATPPPTQRGPFSTSVEPAPKVGDIRSVVERLKTASDRDRIVDLVVEGARTVAKRVAVLAIKRDAIVGWACSPEVADQATFRKVRLSTAAPTVLTEALEQGGAWLARFPRNLAHAPLLEMLKQSPSDDIAIAGVGVEGRPALAIVAADLADPSVAKKCVAELSVVAGEALARLLRERRK